MIFRLRNDWLLTVKGTMPGQMARYILTGAAGLVVSTGVTVVMHEAVGLSTRQSFAIALVVVFTFHFMSNSYFVFRSGADGYTFLRYTGSALAFRALDFLLFNAIAAFTPLYYYIGAVLAIGTSNTIKFLAYRYLVFTSRDKS